MAKVLKATFSRSTRSRTSNGRNLLLQCGRSSTLGIFFLRSRLKGFGVERETILSILSHLFNLSSDTRRDLPFSSEIPLTLIRACKSILERFDGSFQVCYFF